MTYFNCECCGRTFELDKAIVFPNPTGSPIYICETCDGTTNNHKRLGVCNYCGDVFEVRELISGKNGVHQITACKKCADKYSAEITVAPDEAAKLFESLKLPSENTCVCCGEVIPEGRQVCAVCETKNAGEAIGRGIAEGIENPRTGEENRSFYVDDIDFSSINKLLNIHKIIDDAMEKRDRTVSIFISAENNAVSVNVYPVDHDKCQWIETDDGMICSNCGNRESTWDHPTYCSKCGELMHGIRKKKHDLVNYFEIHMSCDCYYLHVLKCWKDIHQRVCSRT